jgi:hypothetical protein
VLCDVVLLRSAGRRLRRSELQPAARGILSITDDSGEHSSFKRPMKVARRCVKMGTQDWDSQVLQPLFDPQV